MDDHGFLHGREKERKIPWKSRRKREEIGEVEGKEKVEEEEESDVRLEDLREREIEICWDSISTMLI